MITKIYVLCEPDGTIRYIGKTCKTLSKRFGQHVSEARNGGIGHRNNWIRSLLKIGKLPSIQLIGEVDDDGCKEEMAWIAYGKQEGWRLLNGTDGGDGVLGCKPMLGKHHSAETRKKISEANKGKHHSAETRRKISEILSGKTPWIKGKRHSAETCKKLSEAHKGKKGYWLGKHRSIETRKKLSNAQKGKPGWWLGKHRSKETIKKMRNKLKLNWAKRKSGLL